MALVDGAGRGMNEGAAVAGPARVLMVVLVLNAGSTGLKASLHDGAGACLWRQQRRWPELGGSEGPPNGEALEAMGDALAAWLDEGIEGVATTETAQVTEATEATEGTEAWREERGLEREVKREVDLALVGHRVVHGGERFTAPTRLQAPELEALEALTPLAPLHNGPALALIHWARRRWPATPQWACFDTAFHAGLPPEARTYALPAAWRRLGLRRFGFHGLNHQHVAEEVARRWAETGRSTRQSSDALRLVSGHLGGGCSLCAIRGGRSLATTMGFTPLEGLVMASRSGSVDPGVLLHLLEHGLSPHDLERGLQRQGGLLGLSELSGSMEVLRAAAAPPPAGEGHAGAQLAIAVFRRRLLEGIGAMAACLEGVDVVALSGGIGEHDQVLRQELEQSLGWLGAPPLLVIPADEEGVIARSCLRARGS